MTTRRRLVIAVSRFVLALLALALYGYLSALTVVTVERGPCNGWCPYYRASIYSNGVIVYEGRAFVEAEGIRLTTIGYKDLEQIVAIIARVDFFNLPDSYGHDSLDIPIDKITVTRLGRTKTITIFNVYFSDAPDSQYPPDELTELMRIVENIVKSKGWIK